MTIIQPNRHQDIRRLIALFSSLILLVFLSGVFIYLQTVTLRHDLSKNSKELENLKVQNSELKNKVYELVDTTNLERVAQQQGFVQEKNPQWASASQ